MAATPVADLSGVAAKLGRAHEHHGSLQSEVQRWHEAHAEELRFEIGRDGPWHTISAKPVPEADSRWALIGGDLIHNVRSALDHLVWQLVLRDGNQPSARNQFPIMDSRDKFLQEVKFRKRDPKGSVLYGVAVDGDAWAIIEGAQPYNCTPMHSSGLRATARLSNRDKHRSLYVHMAFVDENSLRGAIGWSTEAVLLDTRYASGQGGV